MITDHLEKIFEWTERVDFLNSMSFTRGELVNELIKLGFDCQSIPTDWTTYFDVDEMKEMILEYAEDFAPSH